MLKFFKKKKADNDKNIYIEKKMIEPIRLFCDCGQLLMDLEQDVFMIGFETSSKDLKDYQDEFKSYCKVCSKKISYKGLNNRSQEDFNNTIKFFVEEIIDAE